MSELSDKLYEELFDIEETQKYTNGFLAYKDAAKKIWDELHEHFEIKPSSPAKAKRCENRRIELYKDGKHVAGFAVRCQDVVLYVDENTRKKLSGNFVFYKKDTYKLENISVKEAIEILKKTI